MSGNRNAGLRAQFDTISNLGKSLMSAGKHSFRTGDLRGTLRESLRSGMAVRDMFEGSSELWSHVKAVLGEVGVEAVSAATGMAGAYYTGETVLSAAAASGVELGGHWLKAKLGGFAGYSQGQWVVIDNGDRPAMWDNLKQTYVPLIMNNILDDTFGVVKMDSVTQGGFSGTAPADVMQFGQSPTERRESYSYGFYIDEANSSNHVTVFNFDSDNVVDVLKTRIAGVPKAKTAELDSDEFTSRVRSDYFDGQGFGTGGFDDERIEDSVNLDEGAEVVPDAFPDEIWTVIEREDEDWVLCVRDTVGASNNGERRRFKPDTLTNGIVAHRTEHRFYSRDESIAVAWDGGEEAMFQLGGFFFKEVRPEVKLDYNKQIFVPAHEIKEELAILTKIDGYQTHFINVIDGEPGMFEDIKELRAYASPLGDEDRAQLRTIRFFNEMRATVMQGRAPQGLQSLGDHEYTSLRRLCFFVDYIDEARSEFQSRYAARRPRTKITNVTGWKEVTPDLGVRTKGTYDKGQPAGFTNPQDAANRFDFMEEMHAKGFAARPTSMDWEPRDPDTGAEDAGNGMAIGVGLIAAALILAYS